MKIETMTQEKEAIKALDEWFEKIPEGRLTNTDQKISNMIYDLAVLAGVRQ